jgi:hypothetical protein
MGGIVCSARGMTDVALALKLRGGAPKLQHDVFHTIKPWTECLNGLSVERLAWQAGSRATLRRPA